MFADLSEEEYEEMLADLAAEAAAHRGPELPVQFTTATHHIPADGVVRHCMAATACPHTVYAADAEEARGMLADHHHTAHGAPIDWKEMGK